MFHICGKLVEHVDFFHKFFADGTVSCGGLQAAIFTDYQSPVAKVEIQVLGLVGKLLSGPWMSRFYTSVDTQVSHIDVLTTVKAFGKKKPDTFSTKIDFFWERAGWR